MTNIIPIIYDDGEDFIETYKELPDMGVIYVYTLPTGTQYVGQTRQLRSRHKSHKRHAKAGKCPVDHMIAKYDLIPRVIWAGPSEKLNDMEMYFIDLLNTIFPNGWNFTSGGQYCEKSAHIIRDGSKHFKPVLCYSLKDGSFLKEFPSLKDAEAELHIDSSCISRCARAKDLYTGLYVFRYKLGNEIPPTVDLTYISDRLEAYVTKRNDHLRRLRLTPEQYARIGEKQRGKFVSQETRDKISKARLGKPSPLKGRKLTNEQKQRRKELIAERHPDLYERQGEARSGVKAWRAKSIYQRARNGVILARFETIKDAVEATGIDQSAISTCLAGKVKTAGGYIWTLTEDSAEKFGLTVDVPKLMKILQIDENGNVVNEFATSRDAYALTGIKDSSIRRAICNGTTAGGYKWEKVVEE